MIILEDGQYTIYKIDNERKFVILRPNKYGREDVVIHLKEYSVEEFLFSHAEIFESSVWKLEPVQNAKNEYNLVKNR